MILYLSLSAIRSVDQIHNFFIDNNCHVRSLCLCLSFILLFIKGKKWQVFISRQVLILLYGFVLCACRCASSKGVDEDDFCVLSIIYHYLRFESVT